MTPVKYSIIIPHKNIPSLLQRCLDSIKPRNDVQVIVIDDNSDSYVVDFEHFPGLNRDDVEVVLTKEGKGAGFARNVGLTKAVGKWLIFMDADDFFSDYYNEILDSCPETYDIVIYDHVTVMSDDTSVRSNRDSAYHGYIQRYFEGDKSENDLRYSFHSLWGKVIKRSLVLDNQICFDEVKWANDIFFSRKIGLYAKSIHVIGEVFYVVTQRLGSLTSDFCGTKEEFRVRLEEAIKSDSFLQEHGVHRDVLDSDIIIKNYYKKNGAKSYLIQLLSQKFLSTAQIKMICLPLTSLKERIVQNIR